MRVRLLDEERLLEALVRPVPLQAVDPEHFRDHGWAHDLGGAERSLVRVLVLRRSVEEETELNGRHAFGREQDQEAKHTSDEHHRDRTKRQPGHLSVTPDGLQVRPQGDLVLRLRARVHCVGVRMGIRFDEVGHPPILMTERSGSQAQAAPSRSPLGWRLAYSRITALTATAGEIPARLDAHAPPIRRDAGSDGRGARLEARPDLHGRRVLLVVNAEWYFLLHWLEIAKALRAAGAEVIVMTADERGRVDRIRAEGFAHIVLPLRRRSRNPLRELAHPAGAGTIVPPDPSGRGPSHHDQAGGLRDARCTPRARARGPVHGPGPWIHVLGTRSVRARAARRCHGAVPHRVPEPSRERHVPERRRSRLLRAARDRARVTDPCHPGGWHRRRSLRARARGPRRPRRPLRLAAAVGQGGGRVRADGQAIARQRHRCALSSSPDRPIR